ncbi:MAG: T9SS type A sorting domain-containing protein [Ignavibacteriales bacterium]|nr:T9SS type A sorting domain-containing protein [Ignavibacteriales bacterium]
MNRVLKALFLFTVVFSGLMFAQLPTTTLRIIGTNLDSANVLTFSVYLKSTHTTAFEFNGGQYHFDFKKAVLSGGTGTLSILSSGLPTALQPKNPTVTTTTTPGQLRLAANTPPGPGAGITLQPGDSVLIVKLKLRTTAAALLADSAQVTWRSPGFTNPFTKIGAYLASVNTDITSACVFFNEAPVNPPVTITWQSTLTVTDAGSGTGNVVFGQGPTATNGLDAAYGEAALSAPTPGMFDSRFILPVTPTIASLKDFRNDTLRLSLWNLSFQASAAGYPITIKWNKNSLPAGFFALRNLVGSINVNMKVDSQYVLTNNSISDLRIEYNKDFCKTITTSPSWNIVSVPVNATSMTTAAIFPMATSAVFAFNAGYQSVTTVENGKGYWARFDTVTAINVCGTAVASLTVPLVSGWNLLGVYAVDAPVAGLTTTPAGIINSSYFGFTYPTGYSNPTVLQSGRAVIQGIVKSDWVKVTVSDAAGMQKTLYLAKAEFDAAGFDLPPVPPANVFDVRFASNSTVAKLSGTNSVQLQSLTYPVTVQVDGADLSVSDNISGKLLNQTVRNGGKVVINNNALTAFTVKGADIPTVYALDQNYPNPFNPATVINYQLPQNSLVTLKVYDILGKEIATLVNEQQAAGNYTLNFSTDQYRLASGVYIYSLRAGNFTSTKKMVLLR